MIVSVYSLQLNGANFYSPVQTREKFWENYFYIVFLGVNFCMPYCTVFLGVIEKSFQNLVLRVSSGVANTSKQ